MPTKPSMLAIWYKLFEKLRHSTDIDTTQNTCMYNSEQSPRSKY